MRPRRERIGKFAIGNARGYGPIRSKMIKNGVLVKTVIDKIEKEKGIRLPYSQVSNSLDEEMVQLVQETALGLCDMLAS